MLHHLVNRAIMELVVLDLATQPPEGDPAKAAWAKALALRDLLKFEFFFVRKTRSSDEIADEPSAWAGRAPRDPASGGCRGCARARRPRRAALRSSTPSSWSPSRLVARGAGRSPTRGASCTSATHGRQMLLQGRLHSAESVSRELFATALSSPPTAALVAGDGGPGRQAWLDELLDVRAALNRIAQIDTLSHEEVLDGHAG